MNIIEEVGITSKTQAELPYVQVKFGGKIVNVPQILTVVPLLLGVGHLVGPRQLGGEVGVQERRRLRREFSYPHHGQFN